MNTSIDIATPAISTDSNQLKNLVDTVQQLSLARNMETVMRIVRTKARQLTGADGATFVLRDNDRCHYVDEDAIGPLWKGQRFPMKICISGWAMLNRQPAVVENIYEDSRIPINAYEPTFVRSLVMVPIRSMDPIGAIGTYWAQTRVPTKEEITLLQSLADITAVSIENVKVYTELEKRVEERTLELINSLEREREMSALKTRFVSIASHEFRTPLGTILSSTSLLEKYIGEAVNENISKHTGRIKGSVKHLMNVLTDFLTVDTMEQGKTAVEKTSFDLPDFIKETIGAIEGNLKQGQHIQYKHTGDVTIQQDSKILYGILLNLLSNASKYSAEEKPIDVTSEVREGHISISVKDYGIGIPLQDQEKIFSDFYRAKNTIGIQGTGLGLHIVERYVELLNGTIHFSSVPDEGTIFTLHLK